MPSFKSSSVPRFVPALDDERGYRLQRMPFALQEGDGYSEDWLQERLFRDPDLLPIDEIDSLAAPAVPLCRELAIVDGFIDIALVSARGRLTLIECKLWRNPEARREVVAQVLDYAKGLARWGHSDLQTAVIAASGEKRSLFQRMVDAGAEVDEAQFHDAVQANLSASRVNFLIVGDGIKEGVEELVDFLTRDVTLRYRLALIELAVYRFPEGAPKGYILQPRLLCRTTEIKRIVVQSAADPEVVEADEIAPAGRAPRFSLDEFLASIGKVDAELPKLITDFLSLIAPLGIEPSLQRSLTLHWRVEGVGKVNFGSIFPEGTLATNYICWAAEEKAGDVGIGLEYLRGMSSLLEGSSISQKGRPWVWRVVVDGSLPPVKPFLAKADEWRAIIEQTQQRFRAALTMPRG